ncbi:MAG: hypothetical protein L0Z50_20505, partial [Verrucomicrobiales bacterium]|nr:hypothetical protein [Verrucomicrobiales bacterium]
VENGRSDQTHVTPAAIRVYSCPFVVKSLIRGSRKPAQVPLLIESSIPAGGPLAKEQQDSDRDGSRSVFRLRIYGSSL